MVRSASGAQRAKAERPYALHTLLDWHHRKKKNPSDDGFGLKIDFRLILYVQLVLEE